MNTNLYLKGLSNDNLWDVTLCEVRLERNSTLKVIEYLQEISLRKLHLRRGYSSLHEYCVKVLKYSDGGADRRIKAMRLTQDVPETRISIKEGKLNLTTASQLQRVFESKQREKKPLAKEAKLELFYKVESKPKREVEKTIATICPEIVVQREKDKYISNNQVQKTLVISEELNNKIERLKSLRAHEQKDFAVILEELVDRELRSIDPMQKETKTTSPAERLEKPTSKKLGHTLSFSRYIPLSLKREVWRTNEGRCCYIDSKTAKKCNSTYYLQIDHIIPFALGGPTTIDNLQLLCSNHNRLRAIDQFGEVRRQAQEKNPFPVHPFQ